METTHEPAEQFLTFVIGGDEYAVGILRVREILEYDTVTRVPGAPDWVRGVINLRGSVVPVADLAVKLGLAESPVTRRTCIVILEVQADGQQSVMGVVADAVNHVVDLRRTDIGPPPELGTRARLEYLVGMGRIERRFALVLDIDRALRLDEAAVAAAEA